MIPFFLFTIERFQAIVYVTLLTRRSCNQF